MDERRQPAQTRRHWIHTRARQSRTRHLTELSSRCKACWLESHTAAPRTVQNTIQNSIVASALLFVGLTHTHPFNGPLSGTTRASRYQKRKTNLDFTEARDTEWQWHQLGHMQVCTSLQTDNHISTPPLSFLQAGCPSCRPTNSVKALKASH